MGERNNPDAGETTLAMATAAIITARWPVGSSSSSPYGGNGQRSTNGHASAYGHTSANGHAASDGGRAPAGYSDWAPPPFEAGVGPDAGPGYGTPAGFDNGHAFNAFGTADPGPAPVPMPPPVPPAPSAFVPGPGPTIGPAAASFFSAVQPEAVPEIFVRETGEPTPPGRELPPEQFRTQVPPGFERRNFGPFADEPPAPPGGGWAVPEPAGDVVRPATAPDVPRGFDGVPSALLGVLPPVSGGPSMPTTFAPPEPAPWTDSGWVDFPHDIDPLLVPEPALAGVGAGLSAERSPLPRRVPRIPDGPDLPLFDEDPAEAAPDPATQRQELNRIADFLRDDDAAAASARPDGVDLEAVLGAVRRLPAVRDAQLRWNGSAGHTLRIEFADGVDESEVTRSVVRLLRTKLGLGAQPSMEEPTLDSPFRGRVSVGSRTAPRVSPQVVAGRALPRPSGMDGPRLVVENVTVTRLGAEATVEVRLRGPGAGATAIGEGRGPGVDAYLSRIAATAAANAVDKAMANRAKVFVEHVSVVPFGVVEVAVVVVLLSFDGVTEQLSGSAIVGDDPQQAVVRATLAALNRRLESLLA